MIEWKSFVSWGFGCGHSNFSHTSYALFFPSSMTYCWFSLADPEGDPGVQRNPPFTNPSVAILAIFAINIILYRKSFTSLLFA